MNWMKALLAGGMVTSLIGCVKVSKDLSGDTKYAHMMGRRYVTKVEMGVYRSKGEKRTVFRPIESRQIFPERDQIKPPFPIRYYDTIVLGILPAASEFKVVQVKEEGSSGMSFIRYYVEITRSADPQWMGKVLYAAIASTDPVPVINPTYAEELPETR